MIKNTRLFKKTLSSFLGIIIFYSAHFTNSAFAANARVYFSPPAQPVAGQEFSVQVFLDSDALVNAYSFAINKSENLEFTGFDSRNSIVEIWQEEPRVSTDGLIYFGGGSIKAFSGEKGKLVALNFNATDAGAATLALLKAEIFLADGNGTKILPSAEELRMDIAVAGTDQGNVSQKQPAEFGTDSVSPEIEEIFLTRDPFNEEQNLLGFVVKDTDSGVAETLARTRMTMFWSEWVPVSSPVAVSRNVWSIQLFAKDKNNNTVTVTVYDWIRMIKLMTVGLLIILFAVICLVAVIKKFKINKKGTSKI